VVIEGIIILRDIVNFDVDDLFSDADLLLIKEFVSKLGIYKLFQSII